MTRTLTTEVTSYLAEPTLTRFTLTDIVLDSGTIRAFNGAGYLMVGANTYAGIGNYGGIEPIKEDAGDFPRRARMWLSAVGSTNITEALNETMFNRTVHVYRAYYNTTSMTLVSTPERWYKGQINEVALYRGDSEKGDYIELNLQIKLQREANASYYTKEDHWLTYSGDTFFTHMDKIPNYKSMWGQKQTVYGGGGGGGGRGGDPMDIVRD